MGYPHWCTYCCTQYCSIWTSFCKILMSYFIYSVVKTMGPVWSFVKKLDRGAKPRFHAIDTWSSPQKNLILTLRYLCQNFRCHVVALIEVERFRIVTHCYAASFSWKLILCETNNIFCSRDIKLDTKIATYSESPS